jgi:hypothetical protein
MKKTQNTMFKVYKNMFSKTLKFLFEEDADIPPHALTILERPWKSLV